jgi:hypothetical protein
MQTFLEFTTQLSCWCARLHGSHCPFDDVIIREEDGALELAVNVCLSKRFDYLFDASRRHVIIMMR